MKVSPFLKFCNEQGFIVLLCMLLLLLLIGPILSISALDPYTIFREIVWTVVFSAVLLVGYFAMGHNRYTTGIALGLVALAIATQFLKMLFPGLTLQVAHHVMGMVFMLFNIAMILRLMFSSRAITTNIIAASLCLYLLLAVVWSQGYSLLELLEPGSFNLEAHTQKEFLLGRSVVPLYFSLVTITTLGYGDIVPVSQAARMLSQVVGGANPASLNTSSRYQMAWIQPS